MKKNKAFNPAHIGLSGEASMSQVNIYEAKTHFSKYVEQAEAGNDVIIARGGKQVARLTSIVTAKRQIKFGVLKGKVRVAEDFDAPLSDDVLADFEGL